MNIERFAKHLTYNPDTGVFVWRRSKGNRGQVCEGKRAGTRSKSGHRKIVVEGKSYMAHQLAWLFCYGEFANSHLDHINGDPDDNRIVNLRKASISENCCNRGKNKNNKLGIKGVYKNSKCSTYSAFCSGKYLGSFKTAEEASKAYKEEAQKVHGKFYYRCT